MMLSLAAIPLSLALLVKGQTYSATYLPTNAPAQSEQGQSGTNQCGSFGASNQNSSCQNSYLNSVTDFCLFAPPDPGPGSVIGNTERIEVSWCMKSGYGTRLIPDGSIQGAHFVQTPDFVQVTGVGDLTKINIPSGDEGGELDPHGADGNGNPIGGLVFSTAFGSLAQLHEWTNFVSDTMFCFRACKDAPGAPALCNHIYDVMGCFWNMPANYSSGIFENCLGDSGEPMGVYGTSTFFQGEPATPDAHPAPASSSCTFSSTIGNGLVASAAPNGTSSGVVSVSSTSVTTAGQSSPGLSTSAPPSASSSPLPAATSSITVPSTTPAPTSAPSSASSSSSHSPSATGSGSGASANSAHSAFGPAFTFTGTTVAFMGVFLGLML